MRLIIVRHGETGWTLTGRYTGVTDVPLTANGRRQAGSLRLPLEHVLQGQDPVVVSSPRQRAIDTTTHALPGYQVSIDPLVAEYDYGDYEGLTSAEIRRRRRSRRHVFAGHRGELRGAAGRDDPRALLPHPGRPGRGTRARMRAALCQHPRLGFAD